MKWGGGEGRNRTDDAAFAEPCLTTWLPRHPRPGRIGKLGFIARETSETLQSLVQCREHTDSCFGVHGPSQRAEPLAKPARLAWVMPPFATLILRWLGRRSGTFQTVKSVCADHDSISHVLERAVARDGLEGLPVGHVQGVFVLQLIGLAGHGVEREG